MHSCLQRKWRKAIDIIKEIPKITFYRGRVGLYAILKALGVGEGDEVATQAFTCLAVPEGIMATGAKPLFIDTEEGGVNMCPLDLESKLTDKVKAVVVQHTFGIPAQIAPIRSVIDPRGLPMVEDCCHTFASTYVNQVVGIFGVGAFYSFEWGKPIVAGIGGCAVINDPDLRRKVLDIADSMVSPSWKRVIKIQLQYWAYERLYKPSNYWKVRSAFQKLARSGAAEGNYNPTEGIADDFTFNMAKPLRDRLVEKLKSASEIVERAKRIAEKYDQGVVNKEMVRPTVPDGAIPVYARYPLLYEDKARLLARAEESNIEIADWYRTPIHPLGEENWRTVGLEKGSCPRAEQLSKRIISLPINQKVKQEDIDRTLGLLNE